MKKNKYKFTLYGRLPALNKELRRNNFGNSKIKGDLELWISNEIKTQLRGVRIRDPFAMAIKWYNPNRRRDHDNIEYGIKYILDAAQKAGLIANDGPKFYNGGVMHMHGLDREHPRIEIWFITNHQWHIDL